MQTLISYIAFPSKREVQLFRSPLTPVEQKAQHPLASPPSKAKHPLASPFLRGTGGGFPRGTGGGCAGGTGSPPYKGGCAGDHLCTSPG